MQFKQFVVVCMTWAYISNYMHVVLCRMAPEVIACDDNPDATYDNKVNASLNYKQF